MPATFDFIGPERLVFKTSRFSWFVLGVGAQERVGKGSGGFAEGSAALGRVRLSGVSRKGRVCRCHWPQMMPPWRSPASALPRRDPVTRVGCPGEGEAPRVLLRHPMGLGCCRRVHCSLTQERALAGARGRARGGAHGGVSGPEDRPVVILQSLTV